VAIQAITPIEAVVAHNPHRLPAFWRKAAVAPARRDPTDVHGQPGFVHRSAGGLRSIDSAPRATTAVTGAPIDGPLLKVGAKRAIHTRPHNPFSHPPPGPPVGRPGITHQGIP